LERSRSPKVTKAQGTADTPTPADPSDEPGEIAGNYYGEIIADQLADERARKESFERRGLAVISSSGVIVSVLLGIAAVVTSVEGKPPRLARWAFLLALVFFAIAAGLGVVVNIPRRYQRASADHLRPLLEDLYWRGRPIVGKLRTAELRLRVLKWAEAVNDKVGRRLIAGLIFELLALMTVALAVTALILNR
jgi:hypothetical protein